MTHAEHTVPSWLSALLSTRDELPPVLAAGTTLSSRYRIAGVVGRGGFGVVYEAEDLLLKRRVALKMIHAARIAAPGPERRTYVRLFIKEARTTSQLAHPAILTVHDLRRARRGDLDTGAPKTLLGTPYFVSELLKGTTLRAALPDLELAAIAEIMMRVAEALEHAHQQGVLHRDLKPENIFLTDTAQVKVLDFGIAESLERAQQSLGEKTASLDLRCAGTPGYMAPEQIAGEAQDGRTDVFALGVMFYEALVGSRPNSAEPTSIRAVRTDVHAALEAMIIACLAPDRARRPAIGELVDALGRFTRVFARATRTKRSTSRRDCPFPGLASFDAEHAAYYFGRERELRECSALFERGARRWLWLEGPSGIGKSSFVAAGLVPLIASRWTSRHGTPPVIVSIKPGLDLVAAFDRAIEAAHTGGDLFLVIDQLEEIFAARENEAIDRAATLFSRVLAAPRARMLTAIRSDFVPELRRSRELAALLNAEGQRHHLEPMSPEGFRHSIECPSAIAGIEWEAGLLDELLRDAQAAQGRLPLVAQTLRSLVDGAGDGPLTQALYRQLGGLSGCLAGWAERAFVEAGAEERVRALFLALVHVAEDRRSRRVLPRSEAIFAAGGGEEGERIVELLLGASITTRTPPMRLLATRDTSSGPAIELIHEDLLWSWPRLSRWVDEHALRMRARDDLEATAIAWDDAGRPEGGLARGAQLDYFSTAISASVRAQAYLEASALTRGRRLRRVVALVSAAFAALLALTAWAWVERGRVEELRARELNTAKSLVDRVSKKLEPIAGSAEARVEIARIASELFPAEHDPSLAGHASKISLVMAGTDRAYGTWSESRAHYLDAVAKAEAALAAAPGSPERMSDLAAVLKNAGWVLGYEHWVRQEALLRELAEREPLDLALTVRWLDARVDVAKSNADARSELEDILARAEGSPIGLTWKGRRLIRRAKTMLAGWYHDHQARLDLVEQLMHEAIEIERASVSTDPSLSVQRDLAYSHWYLASIYLAHGRAAAAIPPAKDALVIFERIAALDPDHRNVMEPFLARLVLASAFIELEQREQALALMLSEVRRLQQLAESDPSEPALQVYSTQAWVAIARAHSVAGDSDGAAIASRAALSALAQVRMPAHPAEEARLALGTWTEVVRDVAWVEDPSWAVPGLELALRAFMAESTGPGAYRDRELLANALAVLAEARRMTGDLDGARAVLRASLELWREAVMFDPSNARWRTKQLEAEAILLKL